MDYELDDDPARIQPEVVWEYLSADAYWGRWRSRADIEAQLASAWRVVGVYRADTGEQVGFARAVSDGVGFAYLADVFVLEAHRGRGLGVFLIESVMAHPALQGLRRFTLATRDAHDLYRRFGFTPLAAPDRFMERFAPDVYAEANAS